MRRGTFVAVNRPPGCIPIIMRPSPDLFGLTDATSNEGAAVAFGCVCCPGALKAPTVTGAAMEMSATPVRRSLVQMQGLTAAPSRMICSIRLFRSEPETPATQANDDRLENLQTFKMLRA